MEAPVEHPTSARAYSYVQPRISTAHGRELPPAPLHTTLEQGVLAIDPEVSPVQRARTARRARQFGYTSERRGNPMSQSLPDTSANQQETTASSLKQKLSEFKLASGAWEAPADASDTTKKGLPPALSTRRGAAGRVLNRQGSNQSSNSTASKQPGQAGGKPVEPTAKYVADVAKMMEKVRAGQALMDKLMTAAGQAPGCNLPYAVMTPPPAPPGANSQQLKGTGRRGAAASRVLTAAIESRPMQVYTQVTLPAAPQHMLMATGKASGAQLLTNVLEKGGYTRTDMRKILDQLPTFTG